MNKVSSFSSINNNSIVEESKLQYINDIAQIQMALPHLSLFEIEDLLVNRSEGDAKLVTLGLHRVVTNREIYTLGEQAIVPVKAMFPVDLEKRAANPASVVIPPYVEIEGLWDKTPTIDGKGKNLFGDNGRLYLHQEQLTIPCVEATEEMLAYYGATLIQPGEAFTFPDESFWLWHMYEGPNHLQDYLLTDEGKGFWLEEHADQPHINYQLEDGGGFYPMAKWAEDKENHLHITAFKIPPGYGLYIKKGAIHSGSCFSGHFIEGYMTPQVSSTVHMQVSENNQKPVKVAFQTPIDR